MAKILIRNVLRQKPNRIIKKKIKQETKVMKNSYIFLIRIILRLSSRIYEVTAYFGIKFNENRALCPKYPCRIQLQYYKPTGLAPANLAAGTMPRFIPNPFVTDNKDLVNYNLYEIFRRRQTVAHSKPTAVESRAKSF